MVYYISPPPQGPLARLVTGVIAVLVLVGALMLGVVAFLVIAALAIVAGIAIWLRVWWIKRRLEKEGFRPREASRSEPSGHVIDAEYTVVDEPDNTPGPPHGN